MVDQRLANAGKAAKPPSPSETSALSLPGSVADAQEDAECCKLLSIAAELRNTIHEMVFWPTSSRERTDLLTATPPSKEIRLTCRRVNEEARGLYHTAYRSYWTETSFSISFPVERPWTSPVFAHFTARDLARVRFVHFTAECKALAISVDSSYSYLLEWGCTPEQICDFELQEGSPIRWVLKSVDGARTTGNSQSVVLKVSGPYSQYSVVPTNELASWRTGNTGLKVLELDILISQRVHLKEDPWWN
ncbi:hypothetical protein LTS10_009018 [Elasticomyces elasticus]|nr:hypothetical protein LTS10_009018 [Elasticomyces elasticus]